MTEHDDNVVELRMILDEAEEIDPVSVAAASSAEAADANAPPPAEDGGGGARERRSQGGLPDDCPVEPLGINGELCFYLDASDQLRAVKAEKHGRLTLQNLYGAKVELIYKHWPKLKEVKDRNSGEVRLVVTNWRPEAAAEALMAAAARRGVWDVFGRVRGPGAWLGDAGELVLHVGDGVCRSQPPGEDSAAAARLARPAYEAPGLSGRHVYPAAAPQPRPSEAPAPAGETGPGARLLATLKTWAWARPELDPQLLLGWLAAALLGGAIEWRPLAWITGDTSTGKSTLHKLIHYVQGEAILSTSNATAAGLWQKIGHSTLPVAIDELEAQEDNRKAQAVIELARQAASGGVILRGGAEHQGAEFTARSCFLFSSILIPPLLGQDRSRMAILQLRPLDPKQPPPNLKPGPVMALGAQLRRRLLDQWPRWTATVEAFRQQLVAGGHAARSADQFGTLLAAADLLLADYPPDSEELEHWAEQLPAARLSELADNRADHERFIEHLTTFVADIYRSGQKQPLGRYIMEAAGEQFEGGGFPDTAEGQKVIGAFGLKVVREPDEAGEPARYLAVAQNHQGLANVFAGTHWAGRSGTSGVWNQACERVPGARRRPGGLRFNGVMARCWLLPLDQVLDGGEGG